ncbi:uncharacterized protein LOC126837383 [Adelges cooleyi]|uniref:uncharacterized protein LOC126837383 n=1 Tax=Adelges cooleyi TaxID=133065 RepID=UPI002180591D|nr:uncharacterized protein LOC126837383 [Adelges cooleyi]
MYPKMYVIFLYFFVYFQVANAGKLSEEQVKCVYSMVQWSHDFNRDDGVNKDEIQIYLKKKLTIYGITEQEVDEMTSDFPDTSVTLKQFLSLMDGYDNNIVDPSLPIKVDYTVQVN